MRLNSKFQLIGGALTFVVSLLIGLELLILLIDRDEREEHLIATQKELRASGLSTQQITDSLHRHLDSNTADSNWLVIGLGVSALAAVVGIVGVVTGIRKSRQEMNLS